MPREKDDACAGIDLRVPGEVKRSGTRPGTQRKSREAQNLGPGSRFARPGHEALPRRRQRLLQPPEDHLRGRGQRGWSIRPTSRKRHGDVTARTFAIALGYGCL